MQVIKDTIKDTIKDGWQRQYTCWHCCSTVRPDAADVEAHRRFCDYAPQGFYIDYRFACPCCGRHNNIRDEVLPGWAMELAKSKLEPLPSPPPAWYQRAWARLCEWVDAPTEPPTWPFK